MSTDYRDPNLRSRMVQDALNAMGMKEGTKSPEQILADKANLACSETIEIIMPIVQVKGYVDAADELKLAAVATQCLVDRLRGWDKEELITLLCAKLALDCVERVR